MMSNLKIISIEIKALQEVADSLSTTGETSSFVHVARLIEERGRC